MNCIDVTKRPSDSHFWNLENNSWELDTEFYLSSLRYKRNIELKRTDKFMIKDFPISEADMIIAESYRQALRDCPNQANIEDCVMPICPVCLEK
jgi:hypothetical protein